MDQHSHKDTDTRLLLTACAHVDPERVRLCSGSFPLCHVIPVQVCFTHNEGASEQDGKVIATILLDHVSSAIVAVAKTVPAASAC